MSEKNTSLSTEIVSDAGSERSRRPSRSSSRRENRVQKSVARTSSTSLPTIDLPFLLGVLRKQWLWVFPLGLLLAGVGCAAVLGFFQPTYEARFRLEVDNQNFVVFKQEKLYSTEFIDLQKAILLGNNVLEKAVADQSIATIPRIMSARDPVDELRRTVLVSSGAGNRLMDVKFRDQDPKIAASVVNTVVDEYMRARRTLDQIKASTQERNVMAALTKAESEVESSKQRVRDLSMQTVKSDALVGETASGRIDTTYLDDLRMKRMELQSQLTIQELNLAEARSVYEQALEAEQKGITLTEDSRNVSDEALEADIVVASTKNQLEAAQRQLLDLETGTNIGEKNPVYIQAKRKIEFLTRDLEMVRNSRRKELSQRNEVNTRDSRKDKLEALESAVAEMKTKKETIENQVSQYMSSLRQPYASSVDLQFAEADLEEWNEIRKTVHNRRIQLQTEREATDVVRELERAIPPRLPVEDLPYKQLAAATAVGLTIPFLLAVFFEVRSRRVDDASQLESRSQLSVLGEISSIPLATTKKIGKRRAGVRSRELRLFEESVDALSTALILREDLSECRVFAVTSALSGEGKTSVSSQLAVSIARATGKRVLIVDGDMRAPDIHNVFGRENNGGLVSYLSQGEGWRELLDTEWSDSVHVLSAGHLKGSPHRILSGGGLEALIAEAREDYEYILIDTPPVLPASESMLFAKAADSCLICALRDRSRIEQLIQAYHRLEASGARVAGFVLSGVPVREYASYYGDYYASKSPSDN
jgi:capsular exopolysaccharide synthesis family protein